jgi:hypothetical protein
MPRKRYRVAARRFGFFAARHLDFNAELDLHD